MSSEPERLATLEQWRSDLESSIITLQKTIKKHDARCDELDTFKKKWVFGIILIGILFGSIGTFVITNSDWIWNSLPVPRHVHPHHHDENGDMVIGEGIWGS